MTSGAAVSFVLDRFLRVKGSSGVFIASSSSSTSSVGGLDGAAAIPEGAVCFEEMAALFLLGEEVVAPPAAFAVTLDCVGPGFSPRSCSESNSIRVLIHP